ncbi:prolipoprotein diacylglyceryl transferase [Sulfurovum sp. bin170]|uniref:prolipoprotein diacylglyceryl transferase n=1 Tax=Sulfurovum sp. bin170 TaxID=2695268 RepID=UPI0013DFDB61|nr:prolipoprotein diacylglyceryl transferase [Sulfurovum sp. bin170]NEW60607.1 prolipoprotein diacylglyceryl transferase [Sulfurovum sp. bin170]
MEFWQHIYSNFDPVALDIFGFKLHWYGLMYISALMSALYIAEWIIKKDSLNISYEELNAYFIYAEIGVILGARIGYFIFYDPNYMHYLIHPWEMFNPFDNSGEFVGIRGMSYHGAMIGFVLGSWLFVKKYKVSFLFLMDLVAISVPLAYTLGRIGNFLNKELIGRETDLPIGIFVDGVLRHPSQLYEAFLEGVVLFIIIYAYRKYKRFNGELMAIYLFGYGVFRYIIEYVREPDVQLGFVCCGWMTMGQLLCVLMMLFGVILYFIGRRATPIN